MWGRNAIPFGPLDTWVEGKVKVLVTGGAGFIGSHVVDAYVAAGHEVLVLDNLFTGKKENVNPKARLFQMELLDEKLFELLRDEKVEAVNHHAAQINVKSSLEDPYYDVQQNVLASVLLLDLCRRANVKRLLFASSGGAMYGEADQGAFPEDTRPRPFSVYGVDKYAVELYADVFVQNFGLEFVALRYANVYGPRQDPYGEGGVVAIFANGMLKNREFQIYGDGLNIRDYVYVKDVAQANLMALTHPTTDAFNIGTGIPTNTNQLYEALAKLTGWPHPIKRGLARLGDLKKSLLDPAKAENMLDWKPNYSLERGLAETVEYFKKIG